jgi:hypothetical protein
MLFDAAIELQYNDIPMRTGSLIDKCARSEQISNNFLNGTKVLTGILIFAKIHRMPPGFAGFRNYAGRFGIFY